MARTTLASQAVTSAGLAVSLTAANVDGHFIDGTGDVLLDVLNGSGGSINVTIQTPGTQDGQAIADLVVAVGAGARKLIGPFPPRTFTRESGADTGKVYVDFSAVTTVTVAAVQY